jgi:hypothetical protein
VLVLAAGQLGDQGALTREVVLGVDDLALDRALLGLQVCEQGSIGLQLALEVVEGILRGQNVGRGLGLVASETVDLLLQRLALSGKWADLVRACRDERREGRRHRKANRQRTDS